MKTFHDVAVIGLGTMGAFACCELARRGVNVIGFDRFSPPHDRGSHSGDTRVFRIAYAEHPDYVPLALRAGDLWEHYEGITGVRMLTRCGMLSIGPKNSPLLEGILTSSRLHRLPSVELSSTEIRRQFPAFAPADHDIGVFESRAGWIDATTAIDCVLKLASRSGARLVLNSPVTRWSKGGEGFMIATTSGTVEVKAVIVTAGAWAAELLSELALPLRVERKVLTWVNPLRPELFEPGVLPVFAFSERLLYGFPNIGGHGVKLAVHWSEGIAVEDSSAPVTQTRDEDAVEPLTLAARFLPALAGALPDALQRVTQQKTCLYVNSPDGNFILDQHPEASNLIFAAGFSGHGFKFAPAVGEALADLATAGKTALPIGFLRAQGRIGMR